MGNHRKRRACRIGALGLLALSLASAATAQLTPAEREGIRGALYLRNMVPADLEFERKAFECPWRSPWVNLGLDRPLEAADRLMEMHAAAREESASELVARASQMLFAEPLVSVVTAEPVALDLSLVPAEIQAPVGELVQAILRANAELRAATAGLLAEERTALIQSLPVLAAEDSAVKFDFVRDEPLSRDAAFAMLSKVDLRRIVQAGQDLMRTIEATTPALRAARPVIEAPIKLRIGGLPVVLAGTGNDIHLDRDAALTLDFGGDDTYAGRHGAGAGYASVLIDLGGEDNYRMGDLNIGAGLLGIGIAVDSGGHDVFRGGSLTLGAGLAGVGVFIKDGGHTSYASRALTQGFGQFGVGLMIDTRGDDRYTAELYSQGASRTLGVGWLVDRQGSDIYRAGGLVVHTPLFADVHYSFSQAFSIGYREDSGGVSGGVALLTDGEGDDYYLAETFAQGAAYWFSLASLLDVAGNDTYSGHHYVQSSSMHFGGAYLFDLAGDDSYTTKFGASHAIGHDYGVAMLVDRAGNDIYVARDSTPGIGNANGVGIFLEVAGDDRYQGPPGTGNGARGSGSVGVFADLAGQDRYRDGLADGEGRVDGTWGVALDQETEVAAPTGGSGASGPTPTPGSLAMPTDPDMEELYRRASQWGVGTAARDTAEALDTLVAIGIPALEWMIERKLAGVDRFQVRTFAHMARNLGEDGRLLLAQQLLSDNDSKVRNALSICIEAGVKEAGPGIPALIERPTFQKQAVRAAGALGGEECVSALLPLAASQDRMLALSAMVSLAQIGSETAYTTAEALLTSSNYPIRMAALSLVARFPLRAMDSADRLLFDSDERVARIGIEVLAAVGTPEALEKVAIRLMDPSAGLRIQALLALNGRCPEAHRPRMLELANDPVPEVRSVARRVDIGR